MMRPGHLARHVCQARTGIIRDATSCQSRRPLCLRSCSPCVSVSRRTDSRQPYSTGRFSNDEAEARTTEPPETGENFETKFSSRRDDADHKYTKSAEHAGWGLETQLARQRTSRREQRRQDRTEKEERLSGKRTLPAGMFSNQHGEESPAATPPSTRKQLTWLSESFRRVLRRQTSGVTVITSRAASGEPVGATISSFTSVALVPKPFFSFNLKRQSRTFDAIIAGSPFNVHMLDCTKAGVEVAEKFVGRAPKGPKGNEFDKDDLWKSLDWEGGEKEAPLLKGHAIPWVFHCTLSYAKNVADHVLMVAEVVDITPKGKEVPQNIGLNSGFLAFRDGWYREPGHDFDDGKSRVKQTSKLQALELLKIKEERRIAHEKNLERAMESQRSRAMRAEYEHTRRQEAHERKQENMRLKQLEHDWEGMEERVRADERRKVLEELDLNPGLLEGRKLEEVKTEEEKKVKSDPAPVIAPWTN